MSETRIITLGCRLNGNESEVMRAHARAAGLDNTVIVNSCAVTQEAVRQTRQAIRKARRSDPDARIVVTGCAAQIAPGEFAEMAEVDHVLGNSEKMQASTFVQLAKAETERVVVNDIMGVRRTASHLLDGFAERARAYVQIQNGCDHRCTFCIIPYGRGNSRSAPAGEVVEQVRNLVESGYREVVLTGVDITSYGADLPGNLSLGSLVRKILRMVPELSRLRLSSIDSIEADDALLRAIGEEDRLMPHLHLSLQAGDDMILKRMKRRHLRADAIDFCAKARALRPDVTFGADFIAGFPTETEEMFQRTLDLVEDCELTYLHVFPFSPRRGTPAARMPQLSRPVIKERAKRLRDKGENSLDRFLHRQVGNTQDVLVERDNRGRTPQFAEVALDRVVTPGSIVKAALTDKRDRHLVGEINA